MERSVSLVDRNEWLSQDRCEHPIANNGHIWPNKIQILDYWEEGMPKPPRDRWRLDRASVAAKLTLVRKTTKLGSYLEPQLKADGHVSSVLVPK
jgi:hypothetical protein